MKKILVVFAGIFFMAQFFATITHSAAITNGDFETGSLTGWVPIPESKVAVVSSAISSDRETTYNAYGNYMAQLTATSTLSQFFTWEAGDTIQFDWAFLGYETRKKVEDKAYYFLFSINFDSAPIVSLYLESLDTAKKDDSGWQHYSYTFTSSGAGLITFVSENGKDNRNNSLLLLDNVSLKSASPVPIPGSALLLGSSLLGLIGIGSRRKGL